MEKALGEFIKKQREKLGVSQRDIAKKVAKPTKTGHISDGYLSQIEKGEKEPSADVLIGLAKALELPPDSLLRVAGLLPAEGAMGFSEDEIALLYRIRALPLNKQEEIFELVDFWHYKDRSERERRRRQGERGHPKAEPQGA